LTETDWTPAGLWLAVVASGLYHGVSPGMGWPLAVSAGLMERSSRALVLALWRLTVGHLLAMLVVIFPFALLVAIVEWQQQIQIGASLLVIGFGVFRFFNRRHPRVLARIRPTQLGLWSFAASISSTLSFRRTRAGPPALMDAISTHVAKASGVLKA
jgi:hypothetical protein